MKKLIKNKNRYLKSANNHKIPNYHILMGFNHNVSKGLRNIFRDLTPIYDSLNADFDALGLVDLEFYERWLNGRY